ncbi:MAG: ClbS/DfsB family four-helix bundle protein [Pseudomonadota bacterium]
MPAQTKADLNAITDKEYAKLWKLIATIDANQASAPDADGVSIKDIVGHRAHWIDLFLGWHEKGLAGEDVAFPAPGYKWNELPRYNADLRARQAELTWAEATALLANNYKGLSSFLATYDAQALYAGPMQGAKNAWTVGRWAEASGASHFRSAAKYIRARLKAMTQP